jgi:3-hydroxyacyl-CoA dehydrogenase
MPLERGVHTFFRALVASAATQQPGFTYKVVGQELARHTYRLLEERACDPDDVDACFEELLELLDFGDDDGVWAWYRDHFPRHTRLIPPKRRGKVLDGVYLAFDWIMEGEGPEVVATLQ